MDRSSFIVSLINNADELAAQARVLRGEISFGSREEWEALDMITSASAYLRIAARKLG